MDNQPTPNNQPVMPQPTPPLPHVQPTIPTAGSTPSSTPVASPTSPVLSAQPISAVPSSSPVQAPTTLSPIPNMSSQTATPPKKKLSVGKIILICCILALLIGGGTVAAFFIINTQPNSIVASAFNNLINANKVQVSGDINVSTKSILDNSGIDVTLDILLSGSNSSSTSNIKINLPMYSTIMPIELQLDEVVINNGKVYVKAKGVKNILNRDNIMSISNSYFTDEAISFIENIGEILEDQWIVISIDDVLNNSTYPIDGQYSQEIKSQYNCLMDKYNNMSNYSDELSNVFQAHPFIIMQQQQDSFYNISLDADNLAGYINTLPRTQLVSDIAGCTGETINPDSFSEITSKDVQNIINSFPVVSAKFDGFLDYHLTELKISADSDYYSVSSDLNFSYDTAKDVTIPTTATPIMEIVQKITSIMPQGPFFNTSYNVCTDTGCYEVNYNTDESYIQDGDNFSVD